MWRVCCTEVVHLFEDVRDLLCDSVGKGFEEVGCHVVWVSGLAGVDLGLGFGVVVIADAVVVSDVLWLVLYFILDVVDCVGLVRQIILVVGESLVGEAVPFGFPLVGAGGFGSIAFEYVEGRLCVCCGSGCEIERYVGDVSFLVTFFSSECVFGLP